MSKHPNETQMETEYRHSSIDNLKKNSLEKISSQKNKKCLEAPLTARGLGKRSKSSVLKVYRTEKNEED